MRILVLSLLLISPALAQTPPACAPALEGMVACFADKLCKCNYERSNAMTERPAGFRWDCGIMRPACGTVPAGPPAAEAPPIFVSPNLQGQPRYNTPLDSYRTR